jgi:hypothetical protein
MNVPDVDTENLCYILGAQQRL